MHTATARPSPPPRRRRRPSRWWLLPAAGAPALALAAWLWIGVSRHAALVKVSGSEHAAGTALIVGVTVVFLIAAGALSSVAAVMAGRPRRRDAAADLAAWREAGTSGQAAGPGPQALARDDQEVAG